MDLSPIFERHDHERVEGGKGLVGVIPQIDEPLLLNQRVGKIVSDDKYLFYLYLTKDDIYNYMRNLSSASSAQGNISNKDIEGIQVVVPSKKAIRIFTELTRPCFDCYVHNLGETLYLSDIRDTLLPKLMSGHIRVGVAK